MNILDQHAIAVLTATLVARRVMPSAVLKRRNNRLLAGSNGIASLPETNSAMVTMAFVARSDVTEGEGEDGLTQALVAGAEMSISLKKSKLQGYIRVFS